jgi:hypothetical protein
MARQTVTSFVEPMFSVRSRVHEAHRKRSNKAACLPIARGISAAQMKCLHRTARRAPIRLPPLLGR